MRQISDKDYYEVGFAQPSVETYRVHVKMRTVNLIVGIAAALKILNAMGISKNLASYFSDKAAAQEGTGMYMDNASFDQKYDAAHFCNCTFLSTNAMSSATNTSVQLQEAATRLERFTAATSMQFKKSNVSSDKVIDRVQTHYKNLWLSNFEKGTYSSVEVFVEQAVSQYLTDLSNILAEKCSKFKPTQSDSVQLKIDSYDAALEAVNAQKSAMESTAYEILAEVAHW